MDKPIREEKNSIEARKVKNLQIHKDICKY